MLWLMCYHNVISLSFSLLYLQKIEEPFLSAVKSTLGDRYTDNVDGIYKLTIKFIIDTLVTGFEQNGGGGGGGGVAGANNNNHLLPPGAGAGAGACAGAGGQSSSNSHSKS